LRKLVFLTLGFAAGCGAWAYFLPDRVSAWIPLLFLMLSVPAMLLAAWKKWSWAWKLAFSLIGAAFGIFWFSLYYNAYLQVPISMDGQTDTFTIRASDYGVESAYGTSVEGVISIQGKTYRVRTYLDEDTPILPGDKLTGLFRLRVTTPGAEKESRYYQGKGVFLLADQRDAVTVRPGEKSLRNLPAQMRQRIKAILSDCFPPDCHPFALALVLGDTSGLDYETDTALKISGIRHVAAVSGLHVSIVFALISTVSLKKRWLKALLGIPSLVLFAALAGFSPSVTRACIMAGLMLTAPLVKREYDGPTALSFAVGCMLLANPMAITSVSLQLSVCSVSGIFLFSGKIRRRILEKLGAPRGKGWKARLIRWIAGSVSVSVGSCVLTTPLSAWYFGTVSLVGVVTNLLTLWAISFIFYGILLSCLVYLWMPALGRALALAVSVLIRYVLGTARLLSAFPLAAVYTCSPYITAWLVFCYVLLLAAVLSRRIRAAVCCAVCGLCICLLASWMEPTMDDVRMTVLDVGQGQCILLQSGGRAYMVDCGGSQDASTADAAAQLLLSQGITRLDGLILTHYDRDHAGAVANLLTRIKADVLVLPATEPEGEPYRANTVLYASQDLCFDSGREKLTVFAPDFSGKGNDLSLCVLFDTENCDILITGDRSQRGERQLLERVKLPKVDVLVAGHHGAANAVSPQLLEAVSPDIVCISVGANNVYGHPAEETLLRLKEAGCSVYRTDLCGMITIRR